jgi:hypothetical protein
MLDLLMNPAIQSGAIPLIIAFVTVLVFNLMPVGTKQFAGLGVLIGFIAAYYSTFGIPPLPPKASGQKIAYIAVMAGLFGVFFNYKHVSVKALSLTGFIISALSISWIGWRKIAAPLSLDHLGIFILLAGSTLAIAIFCGKTNNSHKDNADSAVVLIVISIAVAVNAIMGASASTGQNAGALAAALGGAMLLNWPKRRFGLDITALMVPLITISALLTQMLLFTKAITWPLLFLIPALFSPALADFLVLPSQRRKDLIRPVAVGVLAAFAGTISIFLTWFVTPPTGGGY